MDEGGRYQDTGAEVPRYKEELVRNRYRGKALDDDGKGASCDVVSGCTEGCAKQDAHLQYSA